MPKRLLLLCVALGAASAHAAPPAPLEDALRVGVDGLDRWACTVTQRTFDGKGKLTKEAVFRFDPSKPYAEEYTPIRIDGHPPAPKDLADYRKRGETRGDRLARRAAQPKPEKPKPAKLDRTVELNGEKATTDIEHARVVAEDAAAITYEIPIVGLPPHPFPAGKFRLTAVVAKPDHVLAGAHLQLVSPLTVKVIARVKSGDLHLTYARPDPRYPVVQTAEEGNLKLALFFIPISGSETTTRSDFVRVKPYDERFSVNVGALQTIGF